MKRLFFKKNNKILDSLLIDNIQYIEALDDYILIHTKDPYIRRYTVHSTMNNVEIKLKYYGFERIHNSFIINKSKISKIEDNMVYIEQKGIPISKEKLFKFKKQLIIL